MQVIKCLWCGGSFEVKGAACRDGEIGFRGGKQYCSDECYGAKKRKDSAESMRRYRQTERGKAATRIQNLKYKKVEVEIKCLLCGDMFKTARKNRKYCDKVECQDAAKYDRVRRTRDKNKEKYAWLGRVGKCAQRAFEKMGLDKKCEVCGEENRVHLHHFAIDYRENFDKRRDVIPLCPKHHKAIHHWDSVGK